MADASAIAAVRDWVGDVFDEDVIAEAVDTYVTSDLAALSLLRRVRASMIVGGPLVFNVAGDYSQDATTQLAALSRVIDQLEDICGVSATRLPSVTTSQLWRFGAQR